MVGGQYLWSVIRTCTTTYTEEEEKNIKIIIKVGYGVECFYPALRRQGQVDFCEFEASLVYITNSRAANGT